MEENELIHKFDVVSFLNYVTPKQPYWLTWFANVVETWDLRHLNSIFLATKKKKEKKWIMEKKIKQITVLMTTYSRFLKTLSCLKTNYRILRFQQNFVHWSLNCKLLERCHDASPNLRLKQCPILLAINPSFWY